MPRVVVVLPEIDAQTEVLADAVKVRSEYGPEFVDPVVTCRPVPAMPKRFTRRT